MGCAYHPNHDTTELCDHCQADLCDGCALHLENGFTLCNRCMLVLSLQNVENGTIRRQQADKAQGFGPKKGWRPSYLQVLFAVGAMLALLFGGLWFYWHQPVQRPQVVLNSSSLRRLLTKLQYTLARYRAVHKDSYPDSLFDLLPDFLADTGQNRKVLRNLIYSLDAQEGYVLRIKENAPFSGKELVATTKDIRVAGED